MAFQLLALEIEMAKSDGVAIERLVLDVGGKKVELSVEQARRLHSALAELFAEKEAKHVHHHDYPWVWPYPRVTWQSTNGLQFKVDSNSSTLSCNV